ncbi:MAG: RNA polymerase sigma factor [Spirochaetaceae bacterium]|nr:RNA polymerase sigma factor [Spirochaetaceae bacterium]
MSEIESDKEFARLYETVFPMLMRVAYRITGSEEAAEDLCQDALFRLHERRLSFPTNDDAKFWLIRVVKNAALNYAKRKTREKKAYQKAFHEGRESEESSEVSIMRAETRIAVKAALEKLPLNLRMVLILKEYADLNYKEIGRVLGISEGNVKVRVFRARERLTNLLMKEDVDVS